MRPAFWLSYAARSLRRGGRRTFFALFCVIVGVAGVVALKTAGLTVQVALTSNVRAANGGDIAITSDDSTLSTADLRYFTQLQHQGLITQWTAIAGLHGTAVGTSRHLVPFTVQVVDAHYPIGGQPEFVTPSNGNADRLLGGPGASRPGNRKVGASPRSPAPVLITSQLANLLGAQIGSRFYVTGLGLRGLHVAVTGILAETNLSHATSMLIRLPDVRLVSGEAPHYIEEYVNTNGPPNRVAALLRTHFPVASVQTVQDALSSAQQQVHDFQQFLLLVALLALLIAGIGILNAVQSLLFVRRLEIAMLKTMGYRQWALYLLFGLEAALLGLVGGVVGTVLGAGVSKEITDALARALALQVTFQLDPGTLVAGVALGIGATLIFAVLPIVRAASFRPIEILREGAGIAPLTSWPQLIGLVALVALLFVALAAVVVGDGRVALEFVGAAMGAWLLLTGGFAAAVSWLGRLGRPASPLAGWIVLIVLIALTGLLVRAIPSLAAIVMLGTILWAATVVLPPARLLPLLMAARSLSRRRARMAVTLVAFLAGVLAMTVTLTAALSLEGQINQVLAQTSKINVVATAGADTRPALLRSIHHLPGIQAQSVTTLVSTQPVRINGQPMQPLPPASGDREREDDRGFLFGQLSGYDLAAGDTPPTISIVAGRPLGPPDAGTNHVLVRSMLLGPPYFLQPGDTVTLKETGTGRIRTVNIVGFFSRPRRTRGLVSFFIAPVIGDRALAQALGGADAQTVAALQVASSQVDADAVALQRAVPGAFIVNIGDLTALVENILSELLQLLSVITVLVLGAGLAVVANGVALAMFERRREIALFKAIGFGPGSVLRMVLLENALVGLLAGTVSVLAAALILGVISRLAFQKAIGFDPVVALWVLIAAAFLAVVTAYLAARTPVRIRPLEALRNE